LFGVDLEEIAVIYFSRDSAALHNEEVRVGLTRAIVGDLEKGYPLFFWV